MRNGSRQEADQVSKLVAEILERTDKCVQIWEENDIKVIGTDHRDVSDVTQTITSLLRPLPRVEAEKRLLSLVGCPTKRPKLLVKLRLVSTALEGEHPRARLKTRRHKQSLLLLVEELKGGLLSAVEQLFELSGDPARKPSSLASSRSVFPQHRHDNVRR